MRGTAIAAALGSAILLAGCGDLSPSSSAANVRANAIINASASAQASSIARQESAASTPRPIFALPRVGVLWVIGDGISRGDGIADPDTEAFPAQVARGLGWTSDFLLATGFGQSGAASDQAASERVSSTTLPNPAPELIIIELGRNDGGIPASLEQRGVAAAVAAIRAKAGSTPLVIIGPIITAANASAAIAATNSEIAVAADSLMVPFISPISEPWITAANVSAVVAPNASGDFHFTVVGQHYLAGRFLADLGLLTEPS